MTTPAAVPEREWPRKKFGIEVDWAVAWATIFQLADLLTFFLVVSEVGIGGESNPIAAWVWKFGGGVGLSILKMAGVWLVLRFRGRWHVAVWILLLMGVAGAASNVVSWGLTWQ